ncbi:MAG: hypothetical protein JNM31_07705 [Flavobacteriales bacterium]|nr:hypothetical protein [Flavobacteriales bacterium]
MRFIALLVGSLILSHAGAQMALDSRFICERWVLNAGPSLLTYHGVDGNAMRGAEPIRTYALDEPFYWEKRVFLRLDPKDNPALTMNAPSDSILPFVDILNSAVAAGDVTRYRTLDYDGPDTSKSREPIAMAPILLKIDFHVDTLTMHAAPHLVGLSIERPDGGHAHFYYPELSWVLRKYKVRTAQGLITADAYFNEFRFKAKWLNCAKVISDDACTPMQPSLEQQAELDALTEIFLLERVIQRDGVTPAGKRRVNVDLHPFGPVKAHVVFGPAGMLADVHVKKGEHLISSIHFVDGQPHGPYRAFFPDGSLREEGFFAAGLREGKWNSWHPNGNIRSHRIYQQGRLHGRQQVHHANGKRWLEYTMAHGEYEGPHTTWYSDGELKASGTMHEGFISGEWEYHIRIQHALIAHLEKYNSTHYHLPVGVWKDGVISYQVAVTDTGERGAMNNCMLGRCIQWAYSYVR